MTAEEIEKAAREYATTKITGGALTWDYISAAKKDAFKAGVKFATTDPHCCPVCLGKMVVPNGFYLSVGQTSTTSSASPEPCRTCDGGIIWKPVAEG